jgi:LAO/AO transport system kinase
MKLVSDLVAGDVRALSRVISLLESGRGGLISEIYPHTKGVRVIGITGSPGAGKSTLTDQLALEFHRQGKRAAILAIDPSSPFTGGALLGDRIRMSGAADVSGIFIRSMSSRGAPGGLAPRTKEAIYALDAAGFDLVLVETVGVGQGEIDIIRLADTVVVVLVPGMGDGVQALKAGILEIADIFAINKADYEGVERLERELHTLIGLVPSQGGWKSGIVRTVGTTGLGVTELAGAIDSHWGWLAKDGELERRRERFISQYLKESALENLSSRITTDPKFELGLKRVAAAVKKRKLGPNEAIEKLVSLARRSGRVQ